MNRQKYITIGIVLFLFFCVVIVQKINNSRYDIIEVISPFEFVLDKNHNGVSDEGETITILEDYQYISRDDINDLSVQRYAQPLEVLSAFAYLTEKFSSDVLADKKVDYKVESGKDIIYVQGEKYEDIILNSGYVFKDNKPVNIDSFNKRLNQVKKADYRIYNAKSNKYHILTCEYGLQAHNYVLLSKSQLPKGAKPCMACLGDSHIKHIHNDKNTNNILNQPSLTYSTGHVKVFFSDFTTKFKPDRNGNTNICNEIVNQINSAKETIDIAIYGYDRVPKIENAVRNAIARGVKVRLVHDIDSAGKNIYANTFEFSKMVGCSICDKAPHYIKNKSLYSNSIMHNKFYIFDKSVVITGSANLSFTDMSGFNSNAVLLIKSPQIANIYEQEFEQMYNNKFHTLKKKLDCSRVINVNNTILSVYFSPADGVINSVLIPLINSANKYIYIPTFLITDNRLASALINAKKRGVDVKIIVDATNASNNHSKHHTLRQNGLQVKTENYAGKLHSKSLIIDDRITVIGSMNFSSSGDRRNDENVVVVKDAAITKVYKNFFLYLWSKIDNYWLTHDVSAESVYSLGSCSDGIDNDYDGLTDKDDEGCKFKPKLSITQRF